MSDKSSKDELEPEYDLKSLKVRKIAEGRCFLQENAVVLDVDVAKVFPDAEAVNQALRFLIRITKEHQPELNNG